MIGFCYQSTGGEIEIVEDILVDPESMTLRSFWVDRWNRTPTRHTAITVRTIGRIDDRQKKIWITPAESCDRDIHSAHSTESDGLREKGLRDATDGPL